MSKSIWPDGEHTQELLAGAKAGDNDAIDQLLDRSDVDVVFVCGPVDSRVDTAVRILRSGKHVIVEPSAALKPEQLQRLIDESIASNRFCSVWRPFQTEPDFRRAGKVIASAESGAVRAVRFMQHDMSAAMLPGADSPTSRDHLTESTLRNLAGHRIAQVMALVNEPVESSTATFGREAVCFGTGESAQQVLPAGDTTFHLLLKFESGATAVLDLGLSCPVPICTGWIVQGTRGGYHSGKQHITVADGELYDVAVDIEPFDPYRQLHHVIRHWSDAGTQEACQQSLLAELEVARVLLEIGE